MHSRILLKIPRRTSARRGMYRPLMQCWGILCRNMRIDSKIVIQMALTLVCGNTGTDPCACFNHRGLAVIIFLCVVLVVFFVFFLIIWTEGWEIKGELILPVMQARATPPLGLLPEAGGRPSTKASSCLKWLVQVCAAIPPYCGGEYSISICPDSSAGSKRKASRVYLLFWCEETKPTVWEKVFIFLLNSYIPAERQRAGLIGETNCAFLHSSQNPVLISAVQTDFVCFMSTRRGCRLRGEKRWCLFKGTQRGRCLLKKKKGTKINLPSATPQKMWD